MTEYPPEDEPEPLVLGYEHMTGPVSTLFSRLHDNPELQQMFIESPVDAVFLNKGEEVAPQLASEANSILFSLLSNADIMSWLSEYSTANRDAPVSRQQFISDFSNALVERGGPSPALETLRTALDTVSINTVGIDTAVIADGIARSLVTESGIITDSGIVIHSDVAAAGILVTTDHKIEHHQTQDQVQDAQAHHDHSSTQNFEHSSGTPVHGVENLPGGLLDPEYLRATADALVRHAVILRDSGVLDAGGPE